MVLLRYDFFLSVSVTFAPKEICNMVQTVEKKPITGFTPGKRYDFLAAFFRVLENEGIEVQYETVFTEVKDDPGKWSLSIFQKATDIDTLNRMKHSQVVYLVSIHVLSLDLILMANLLLIKTLVLMVV